MIITKKWVLGLYFGAKEVLLLLFYLLILIFCTRMEYSILTIDPSLDNWVFRIDAIVCNYHNLNTDSLPKMCTLPPFTSIIIIIIIIIIHYVASLLKIIFSLILNNVALPVFLFLFVMFGLLPWGVIFSGRAKWISVKWILHAPMTSCNWKRPERKRLSEWKWMSKSE